jgi:dipeptidyl aminopeptidase/acylaminoacyl peptidase
VSEKSPPFLLIHGAEDPTVPPHQAELLKVALEKATVDVQLHLIAGGGHGIGGPEVARLTDAFFDKQLKRP